MKFLDVVRYDGEDSREVFAWRHPNNELRRGTTLQVSTGQTAALFSNGKLVELYSPGKHAVSGNSSQLLTPMKKLFTGGINTDSTSIWFMNTYDIPPVNWGTPHRSQVRIYTHEGRSLSANVGANGSFEVKISDLEKFINNFMVSAGDRITFEYLQDRFIKECLPLITDSLGHGYAIEGIPFDQIATQKVKLADFILKDMRNSLDRFGIEIIQFRISDINLDEETRKNIRKWETTRLDNFELGQGEREYSLGKTTADKNYSDTRKYAQDNEGYTYQERRKFDVLDKVAANEGSSSEFLNMGIGLGTGLGVGKSIAHEVASTFIDNPISDNQNGSNKELLDASKAIPNGKEGAYCSFCGKKIAMAGLFCSHCGKKIIE